MIEVSPRHIALSEHTYDFFSAQRLARAAHPVWTPLNPSDKVAGKVALFGSDTPMKRPAQPEEIAPAYVFLASGQCSSYITGEVLPIIGGYSGG